MPIGIPGGKIPSFPEVKIVEVSNNSNPSGKYSNLGFFPPKPDKIACTPNYSIIIGILLFKSFNNKILDDK